MKKTLLKTLLVAVGLCVGANAWAQTTLYEKGTTGNDWSDADLTDWVVDSDHGTTAKKDETGSVTNVTSSIVSNKLTFNSFGYSYNETKGTTDYNTTAAKAYSFTKSITTEDNTILKLTADWAGGGATGTNSRTCHTFTFGDIAFTLYGSSGGAFLKIGSADAIQIIANANNTSTYRNSVWHIELTVNQSTNVVQYSLSTSALNSGMAVTGNGTTESAGSFNGVSIALVNDKTPNWSLSQTLNSIKITEEEASSTARGINVNFTYKVNGEGDAAAIPEADLPAVTTYYDKEVDDVFTPTYPASFNTADYTYTYTSGGGEYTVTTAEDQTITLLYNRTERTKVDVVVKGLFDETELFSNIVTNIAEGETVVYGFPQYVLQGGVLYKADGPYAVSTTASATPIEVTYTKATVSEGETPVYFNDFGGAAGLDWSTYSGGNVVSDASVELVPASTLSDGIYKIVIQNNRNRTAKVKIGDLEIGTLATGANAGSRVITTFNNIVVRDGVAITAVAGGSTVTDNIDYILIYKTGDAAIPVTVAASGFTTVASAYALDCANLPVGLEAYKVSSISYDAITLEQVTEAVAPGTGLILTGTANVDYNIPVVASGTDISATNKLKAAVTATDVAANEAYILKSGKFCKLTVAAAIPAGKAYLLVSDVPVEAPVLQFIFGDATGISSVSANGVDADKAVFNLQGQRVAQPRKGLYIVNGKKVVLK